MANQTQAQQAAIKAAQIQAAQNTTFMDYSIEKPVLADAQNGTTYNGNTLNFNVPILKGAWATKLTVINNLNITYTPAGSGPFITVNAGGAYNFHRELDVTFGNEQVTLHPYFAKPLTQMHGFLHPNSGQNIGNSNADVQNQLWNTPTITSGANTWVTSYDVDLNALHPRSVFGMLPAGQSGTRIQVSTIPCQQVVGVDPLQNVFNTNGTIVVTGTTTVIAWYRDNLSPATFQSLQPDLTGLPTVQIIKPQEINPLTAGTFLYKRIENPYPFARLISVVIDGNSSSTFCTATNLQGYEVDTAENTSSQLFQYSPGGVPMSMYYKKQRGIYGQDFDDGVVVYDALAMNQSIANLREGRAYLNLTQSGHPAARLGFQVGSVGGVTGITPRVVTYGVIQNPDGIKLSN
jgi:hypothetical protein